MGGRNYPLASLYPLDLPYPENLVSAIDPAGQVNRQMAFAVRKKDLTVIHVMMTAALSNIERAFCPIMDNTA